MCNEKMDQLVIEINRYFAGGFTEKDYAGLWFKVIKPFIHQNPGTLV